MEGDTLILIAWLDNNFLMLNNDKSKFLASKREGDLSIRIGQKIIKCQKTVKLLGIKIDNHLNFQEHIQTICKKASLKLHALARAAQYMNQDKRRILMKAFIEAQFSYCSLIWMFHSRTLNRRINKLHERALRLVYRDHTSTFNQLLSRDKTFSIHDGNLQKLALEMYKVKNNLSPNFMRILLTK